MNYWADLFEQQNAQDHVCPNCGHWEIHSDESGQVWCCDRCDFEWTEEPEVQELVCPECGLADDLHRVNAGLLWCRRCDVEFVEPE